MGFDSCGVFFVYHCQKRPCCGSSTILPVSLRASRAWTWAWWDGLLHLRMMLPQEEESLFAAYLHPPMMLPQEGEVEQVQHEYDSVRVWAGGIL
jgi:hypothetical protein